MHIHSTEIKTYFGKYLEKSLVEPVHILKNNREVAVLISEEKYQSLKAIEDLYLVSQAKEASFEGYASKDELISLIERLKDEVGN